MKLKINLSSHSQGNNPEEKTYYMYTLNIAINCKELPLFQFKLASSTDIIRIYNTSKKTFMKSLDLMAQ